MNNGANIKDEPCQKHHTIHSTEFLIFPVTINILSVKSHSEKSDILTVIWTLIIINLHFLQWKHAKLKLVPMTGCRKVCEFTLIIYSRLSSALCLVSMNLNFIMQVLSLPSWAGAGKLSVVSYFNSICGHCGFQTLLLFLLLLLSCILGFLFKGADWVESSHFSHLGCSRKILKYGDEPLKVLQVRAKCSGKLLIWWLGEELTSDETLYMNREVWSSRGQGETEVENVAES